MTAGAGSCGGKLGVVGAPRRRIEGADAERRRGLRQKRVERHDRCRMTVEPAGESNDRLLEPRLVDDPVIKRGHDLTFEALHTQLLPRSLELQHDFSSNAT